MHVPERLFRPNVAARLRDLLHVGIREELAAIQCEDRGRAFHVFLMLNDQHRHLSTTSRTSIYTGLNSNSRFSIASSSRLSWRSPSRTASVMAFTRNGLRNSGNGHPSPLADLSGSCPLPSSCPKGAAYQWSDSKLFREHRRAKKRRLISEGLSDLDWGWTPACLHKKGDSLGGDLFVLAGIRDFSYS